MPSYVQPRRFARLFQMDTDNPGNMVQQIGIRDKLVPAYGTKRDAMLWVADRRLNARGYSFISIAIIDYGGSDTLGQAGVNAITINKLVSASVIGALVVHEFGHVWDNADWITPVDREVVMGHYSASDRNWNNFRETFAYDVRDWYLSDGVDKAYLTTMLTREP